MTRRSSSKQRILLEAALAYRAAGLSALPAILATKRPGLPGWKDFQSAVPSEAHVRQWFAEPQSAICIVTGAVSGHAEMIDFDCGAELFLPWRDLVEAQAPGLVARLFIERSQGGGMHAAYRCVVRVAGSQKLAVRRVSRPDESEFQLHGKIYKPERAGDGGWFKDITFIETRGEGGVFLCAPSPGYVIVAGSLESLTIVTGDERDILIGAARALNEVVPEPDTPRPTLSTAKFDGPTPRERPGEDFNHRGDVAPLLEKHGWRHVGTGSGGENHLWCRPGKNVGTSATLKAGVFYVFSSNAHPFEPNKAYSRFSVFALLEHGGDYSKAASALREMGYGEREQAMRRDLAPIGVPDEAKPSGVHQPTRRAVPFEPIAAPELIRLFPDMRPAVIEGLLRQGEIINIIAAPKVGKSWFLLSLLLSVANGLPWLGAQTAKGKVLLIDAELHEETLARRVDRMQRALGLSSQDLEIWPVRGKRLTIDGVICAMKHVRRGEYGLIAIDALYRFMEPGAEENSNEAMTAAYNAVDALAELTGAAVVLVHHATKGSQSGKAVTDVGAGGGAQSRAADTHLILREHEEEGAVAIHAVVRSWAAPKPFVVRWTNPGWELAPDLDPAALRQPAARQKKSSAAMPKPEPVTPWTPQRFASEVVGEGESIREDVIARALDRGLTKTAARDLLKRAEHGLVVRRITPEGNGPHLFTARLPEQLQLTAAEGGGAVPAPSPPVPHAPGGCGGGRAHPPPPLSTTPTPQSPPTPSDCASASASLQPAVDRDVWGRRLVPLERLSPQLLRLSGREETVP